MSEWRGPSVSSALPGGVLRVQKLMQHISSEEAPQNSTHRFLLAWDRGPISTREFSLSFTQFNKYLLNSYYMPGIVLGTWDTSVNKVPDVEFAF